MHRIRRALAARAFATLLVLVAVLPAPSARAEGRYALVVGVEKYNPRFLVPLDHAEDDMERVGAALERLGFNVVTMTSAAEIPERRPVTALDILNEVDRRLKNREPTDTIVLAFSGHGVQLKREAGREARETWFCPERARLDDPATLLPLSQVLDRLKACPAKQKLLLVDACRVEVEPKAIRDKSGVPTIELDAAAPFRRQLPEGMAALFSCGPHQKSFELPDTGGVFTHFVVEYLEGRADPSRYRRGEATVQELAAYVSRQTTDHVDQRLREDQEPELVLPAGRLTDWPLGSLDGLAGVDRGPKPAAAQPLRHDAAETRRRVTAARRILAGDLAGLRAELERTPVPAQDVPEKGSDPRERERRMLAWALASLGDREGTLRHVWMPAPRADDDEFYRGDLAEASVRTLGLLKRRRPDADVSPAVRKVFDAGGRYADASARERLSWAFLDADSFLPGTDPAEQERQLALAIDGIGDDYEACIDIVMRNPRHFATVVPRERMAALAERYARTHTWSSADDDDDAPYFAATAIVLAAFADDIEAVERMRASRKELSLSVQQAVVPFALRGDLDRVTRLLARPETEDARLAIAINALLDGGHVALARRLFERVDAPERLDDGGFCYHENGPRDMPDITRAGGMCGQYEVAARTLGRLGEEERCRAMLDRAWRAGGEKAATVDLRWLEFLDGLLTDCGELP